MNQHTNINTSELAEMLRVEQSSIVKKLKSSGFTVINGNPVSPEGIKIVASTYSKQYKGRDKCTIRAAKELLKSLNGVEVKTVVKASKAVDEPKETKTNLQKRLSADWLILSVLIVIIGADMFSFATIGDYEFGSKFVYSWVFFAVMGLAVGLGSIVTYNRIEDKKTANAWKVVFGILQFLLFEFVINEWLVSGGFVMASMFVLVFVGAQRSIKG